MPHSATLREGEATAEPPFCFRERKSSRWAAQGINQFVMEIGMDSDRVRGVGGCWILPN
jgi:hypothetical protein